MARAPNNMRLFGVNLSEINCRVLVAALVEDTTPNALELAERISGGLTRHERATPLTPADRDTLLRNMPKPLPSGLVSIREALASDQRARK